MRGILTSCIDSLPGRSPGAGAGLNPKRALWTLTSKLPSNISRRMLFFYRHGRFPRVKNPVTFNEKVNWRILKDRREILSWTCDKLAMKDYVNDFQDTTACRMRIPLTFWSGTDVSELESVELPNHWVLKPNHQSGPVFFGHGRPDIAALRELVRDWFLPAQGVNLHEWAYFKARPILLAEEFIGVPGSSPSDYKFYVFNGKVAAIEVHADRHDNHRIRYYLPDWSSLEVSVGHFPLSSAEEAAPSNLAEMLAIASGLGRSFDFMRVDLYNVDGEVFFGELTPYPGSGINRFVPASFDSELGAKWELPVL